MTRTPTLLRLVLCVTLAAATGAGCVNHRKSAEAAARAGNWRAAEAHYREALRKRPGDAGLRKRHAEAKQKAFEQALAAGRACLDSRQWPCAVGEADYASGLEPGNAEASALVVAARRGYAMDDLARARGAVTGDLAWGLDMVDHARGLSTEADVRAEAQAVTGVLLDAILGQAGDLRTQAAAAGSGALPLYDRSLALLDRGMRAQDSSPQQRASLESLRASVLAERNRWVDLEYERLARLGDEGLIRNQWPAALASYQAAEQLRPGGRGRSAAVYAQTLIDAGGAIGQRNWRGAADLYRRASAMPEDNLTRRFALKEVERVEVRPYRFRFLSVLVNPLRPDGQAWASGAPASTTRNVPPPPGAGPRGPEYRAQAKGYSSRVPAAVRPNVVVEITLPDGRVLRTADRRDAWAAYDAWFVLDSNQLDPRPLLVRVIHDEGGKEMDLGTMSLSLGSLVAGTPPAPSGSILWTEVAVDQPRAIADGAFGGFASVVPGRGNEATDASSPSSPASVGWRLARVDAGIRAGDWQDEDGKDLAPDLKVEVEQSGRVIYRSPEIRDSADGSWAPENVYVFATPQEKLVVRLFDVDPAGGNDVAYGGAAPAPNEHSRTVEVKTAAGSFARLVFEPRVSGP